MAEEDDFATVTRAEQFKALAHPTRHRLLFALGKEQATISQLAATLGSNKGNIAHHLKVLADAGLVELAATRTARGGTERYYRCTVRGIKYDDASTTETAFRALGAEIAAAQSEQFMTLRYLRLTPEHAKRLMQTLQDLATEAEDAPDQPRHGLLLGLYQPADPGAADQPGHRPEGR